MRSRGPLIGREQELEKLDAAFSAAKAARGCLLLLAGEAGVGKTRLAEAAIAENGLEALRVAATERGLAPYGPIVASFRAYLRRRPAGLSDAGALGANLGALLPELGTPPNTPDRETLFEAIRLGYETIGRQGPAVVFLDDLHWADAATLELLPTLAEAAEEWPLVFLAAYRSEEIPRAHPLRRLRTDLRRAGRLQEMIVEPLDAQATAELAARVLGSDPAPTLRAALYDRTQGIPYFIEELVAALQAGSQIAPGKHGLELKEGTAVPIPETIRDAVRLRVEGLSAEGRMSLETAAAVGARVELQLLTSLRRDAGLDELVDRALLEEVESGVAAFRHDLTREAVYADIHWPHRRSLHRALAELLEARGDTPSVVADHWLAAGEPARARPLLVEAARRFHAVHAYRDAARAGRTALELWPTGEDEPARLTVLDELGRCAELCGELAEAAHAWEEVAAGLDASDEARALAETKRRLATVYELQGATPKAVTAHTEAAELFAACGLDAEAASEGLLAADRLFADDPPATNELLDAAHEAAKRANRGDLESRCLASKAFMASQAGRLDEALELARAGLELALDGKHVDAALDAYWTLGAISSAWGDYASAQAAMEQAVDVCRTHGMRSDEHFCLSCVAIVLRQRGEWERAVQLSRAVLASPAADDAARAHALCTLGLIAVSRGSTKRARTRLREAAAVGRELPGTVTECMFGLALADELDGRMEGRWQQLAAASSGNEAAAPSYAVALRWASTFAARRGEAPLVHECAQSLAELAARFGSAEALAALAHSLGEVALLEGNAERAADQFRQALELLRDVDAPFERAHTQMRAGVALVAVGERELGVEQLLSAYRTFRRLGAHPFATRAAADLDELGEHVEQRLGRVAASRLERGGLTRRELEILRLVAVGRTNREIAHQLFLSPRTVDMHVRNMLSKLGCRSRVEATGKAHELGLLERSSTT